MTLFQMRVAAIVAAITRIDRLLAGSPGPLLAHDIYVNDRLELSEYSGGDVCSHIVTVPRRDGLPIFYGNTSPDRWVCRMLYITAIFSQNVEANFGVSLEREIYG